MRIDTSMIEGYGEMSAEDKVKALEGIELPEKDKNEDEINKFKDLISKANSEAAKYKKELKERMSEEERRKQEEAEERAAMKTELEDLKREKTVATFESKYLSIGYPSELAKETAIAMSEGKTDIVFENQRKFMEEQIQKLKEEAMDSQAKLSSGDTPKKEEKSDVDKLRENARKYVGL